MKCTNCGYDDNGTGDSAHFCPASPVQGAASAISDNKYDCPGDVRFAATSSASGAKGAAVKPWQERAAERWPGMPAEELGQWAKMEVKDAEIADWRALADRSPAVQPVAEQAVPDVEAIRLIADELDAEAMNYEGDFADTVKGCAAALLHLIATPAPEQEAAPDENERNRNAAMLAARLVADHQRTIRTMYCDGSPTGRMLVDCLAGAAPVEQEAAPCPRCPIQTAYGPAKCFDCVGEQEAAQVACTYPSCACVGGGVFKPCVKSGEYREAAQVAPLGAQEAVTKTQDDLEEALACILCEHTSLSTDGIDECVPRMVAMIPAAALPYKIMPTEGIDPALYTAPVPATTPAEQPEGITVKVDRNRVWIVNGAQSFMLAYEAGEGDEPEEIEWYAGQLRTALSSITPCVKSDCHATATNTNQPETLAVCEECNGKGGDVVAEWIDPVSGPECEVEMCHVCGGAGKVNLGAANTNKGGGLEN